MKWIFTPPNFLLIIFSFLAVIVLSPILAISLGLIYSLLYKNISQEISKRVSTIPLQIGIVLLGFTISMATLINIKALPQRAPRIVNKAQYLNSILIKNPQVNLGV